MAHILLIAAWAPPSANVGARRTANFAKFLSQRGHRVSVVTSTLSGHGQIVGAVRTSRAFDLLASPLNWRRGQLATLNAAAQNSYDPSPSRLSRLLVPDPAVVTWLPFALRAAHEIVRRESVDCVVTTAPPLSAHLAGLWLRRRGIAWVADFRDGWSFEDLRAPFSTAALRRADRWLERRVLDRADRIVTTTPAMSSAVGAAAEGRTVTISNGFDDDTVATAQESPEGPPLLVHTGRLGARSAVLGAVIDALRACSATAAGLRLVLAGPHTGDEREIVENGAGLVRHAGNLDWKASLALQRKASVLLLLVSEDRPGAVPAKLYEYLATSRPVLVVGPPCEAARIVERTGTGRHAAADARSIADALSAIASAPPVPDEEVVRDFGWTRLAARYERVIEDAIEDARSRRAVRD